MYTQNDGVDRVTGFENMANYIFVFIVIYIHIIFFWYVYFQGCHLPHFLLGGDNEVGMIFKAGFGIL